MTQSATTRGRGAAATPSEIALGRETRKHYRTPAHMRAAAGVLRNPDPAELKRLGAKPNAGWLEQAELLEREAGRWESEGLIDCT